MVCTVPSLGLNGIQGYPVDVECSLTRGLQNFEVVGLPDTAVKEARERVRAAVRACGFEFPGSRLTVNLSPADRRKIGTFYDLPMLLGILAVSEQFDISGLKGSVVIGELSLSGQVRPVTGALSMILCAVRRGVRRAFVPTANAPEATLAGDIEIYPVDHVHDLLKHLSGEVPISPAPVCVPVPRDIRIPDFADVKGQSLAKRALEVAAAGGHNVLLSGSPGAGKSMLAKRLPSILPDMTRQEALSATEVYSVLGYTSSKHPMVVRRPFRDPHHTISAMGMVGGGTKLKPGEVSMAHNGVLFLDELPEFNPDVLEVLRQPMEEGQVHITRVSGSVTYPARFMLVGAMNPCKCGWYGHPSGRCNCPPHKVQQYASRISGPLMDRIDIFVGVPSLTYEEISSFTFEPEPSAVIRARVNAARKIQVERYGPDGPSCNAQMGPKEMERYCVLTDDCKAFMKQAFERLGLTARSHDRILRLARTIADLDGVENIVLDHLAEAVRYRPGKNLEK